MEAQMHRSYGASEEQPQHTGVHSEGEVEQPHEKKSMLKKVKAKAKKIKDSIKNLGHEPDHGQEQHDDQEDDDEESEDEEMVDDNPEVHGAPIYDSSANRSGVLPHQDIGIAPKTGGNLEHPTSRREDSNDPPLHPVKEGSESGHVPVERTEREAGERFGVLTGLPAEHDSHAHSGDTLGAPMGLEPDSQSPMDKPDPSNYQSKVTDPTAHPAEEAGVPPLIASFGKMSFEDEGSPNSIGQATEQRTSFGKIVEDETKPDSISEPTKQSTSFGKIIVEEETKPSSVGEESEQKTLHTGSHDQFSPQPLPTSTLFNPETPPKESHSNKPEEVIPRETTEETSPAGQGTNSYTDQISSAAYAIADKAVTAKNVVAAKLGYGGGTEEEGSHIDSAATKSPSYSPTEYAQKAATPVSETLAPICGKVAGVGSAMASKVPGVAKGEREEGTTESPREGNKGSGVGMKEYLAEKFRPGEEDKALSETISDSLNAQKEKMTTMAGGGGEPRPSEKVTESEDVARRLGREQENPREGADAIISGSESSGNTVTEKIKNAVTSWVTKGSESPTSHQGSPADSSGNNVEGS